VFLSFQLDILNPQLSESAKTGGLNTNTNIGSSILSGLLVAVFFTAIGLFFFMDSLAAGWTRLIALAIAFLIGRLILFIINLKVYFKRIEL
jgi:hypothetical protein